MENTSRMLPLNSSPAHLLLGNNFKIQARTRRKEPYPQEEATPTRLSQKEAATPTGLCQNEEAAPAYFISRAYKYHITLREWELGLRRTTL